MATTSKTQLLTDVQTALKKRYKPVPHPEKLSILEATIYGICREGTTNVSALQAMADFKSDFFDWNEVRVSTIEELQVVLKNAPDSEVRANRLRRFLRQLFEKTYSFTLDALIKKPQKEAVKALSEYEAFHSDFVMATVIRLALGGHAIPIDGPARTALIRLGIDEGSVDDATLRGTLERAVPKTRGGEFLDLMESLVHDTCLPIEPECPRCELKKMCPTGIARIANPPPKPVSKVAETAKPKVAAPPVAPLVPIAKATKPPKAPVVKTAPPKPTKGKPGSA